MHHAHLEVLINTELFHGIGEDGVRAMLDCLKPRVSAYRKNDFIVTSGSVYDSVGLILKGAVTVSKENAAGDRVVLTRLGKGDIFGEIVVFSKQMNSWPSTVQALENCEILFLPRGKIIGECEKMCSWHRALIQNFLRIISERALLLNKKVEYLTIRSIRGKISSYLLEHYNKKKDRNIILPLNRNELADFLNVSRPSLSREICGMRDEGIIDFHLSAFKILDLERLKEMSVL